MEANVATARKSMLRSQHDQMVANLNSGLYTTTLNRAITPLLDMGSVLQSIISTDSNHLVGVVEIGFVKSKGIWWLEEPVNFIEDLGIDAPFYCKVKEDLVGDHIYRIGIKTFYHRDTAFYSELRRNDILGQLELYTQTKPDANWKYFKSSCAINIEMVRETKFHYFDYSVSRFVIETKANYDRATPSSDRTAS